MTKICTACKVEKTLDRFHKETAGKFGVKSKCAECITSVSQKWKKENNEREQQSRKRWHSNNKDKHKELTYKWREENADKHTSYVAEYQANRKKSDPQFKLLSNMRSLLYNHLTRKDLKKHKKLEQYLCCSFENFKAHIENQFTDDLIWDNYGSYWSIDHICPCSQAQNEDELTKLQHFKNLRPMITHGPDGNFAKSDNKTQEAQDLCLELLNRDWLD
jgi:hypothetical protein